MAATAESIFPEYTLSAATRSFIKRAGKMLINGAWVTSSSGKTLNTYDPATTKVITSVSAADKADVDKAVTAARRALEDSEWSRMVPSDRERLLLKLADLVEINAEELVEIESLDNGKTAAMAAARQRLFVIWQAGLPRLRVPRLPLPHTLVRTQRL